MMEEAGASEEFQTSTNVLTEDFQTTIAGIFDQDPGKAGYELAGVLYELLNQRDKEKSRKNLSWLKLSLFSFLDDKGWSEIEKGTFFLAYSLRWKRGHESLQGRLQGMLDRLEVLEEEISQLSRK
ncbi:MAG: hypothetical protein ACXAEL_14680 [Candidatus Hodarchaeales archaeon]|jgi:hypothetical protein